MTVERKSASPVGARRYVTVSQAAEYHGATPRTVYNMLDDGRLTAFRGLGSRMLRIDLNEIDQKMSEGNGTG